MKKERYMIPAVAGAAVLLLGVLLSSCEGEIPIKRESKEPLLILNAILNASDTEHAIALSRWEDDKLLGETGATVELYVNGRKVSTGVQVRDKGEETGIYDRYANTLYILKASLREGDVVKITAKSGNLYVESEVPVPPAPDLLDVTFRKIIQKHSQTATLGPGEDDYSYSTYEFSLNMKDHPSSDDYYRLVAYREGEIRYCFEEVGEAPREEREEVKDYLKYNSSSDPILTDGYASMDTQDESIVSRILEITPDNDMKCFTDRLFKDKGATLTFSMDSSYVKTTGRYVWNKIDENGDLQFAFPTRIEMDPKVAVCLRSISFDEYCYLRTMNAGRTVGFSLSLIAEPLSIPSNVKGGLGFFAVENESVRYLDLGHVTDTALDPGAWW